MKIKFSAKQIIRWFWIVFFSGIVLITITFILIAKGYIGYMPPVEDLENPINKYASQVISSDMKPLGTFAQKNENRIYANYQDLSPHIVHALIATEDARFTKHSGIDAIAMLRVVFKGLFDKNAGGGSTITQQLAKQLYSPTAENFLERMFQKPIEWVIAVQLERFYTKEEIVNMYLNKFDFLYNAVGIQSAAWVYFGKTPKDLTVEEAATLIGMCKNPSYYNPIRRNGMYKDRTLGRRNVVLDLMEKHGYITKAECDSLHNLPLVTRFHKLDHKDGPAPYFREYLRLTLSAQKPQRKNYPEWQRYKYAEDSLAWETNPLYGWCNKNKKPDGSNYNLATDGLKIYTTINSQMQTYAEEAVVEHIGGTLQPLFFNEKKGRATAPFASSTGKEDITRILDRAMKQSERYRLMKDENLNEKEIRAAFNQPTEMTVFTWKGVKDTIMTPMDSIRYMKSFLRSGFMVMDPRTGSVKAYVGGTNFQYFQYDMINTGRRQVGSTVKPFLYSLAMESGFTPCDEVLHVEQQLITETGVPWNPKNANKERIGEMVTVKWGLQKSDNWVTAYLMKQLSPYTFARKLHSFGLIGPIEPVVSLCLGSCDASVSEMVSGYSAFANKGVRVEPNYVTRIEDKNGNIIASFSPRMADVLTEDASFKMLDMLRSVIDAGTGGRIRGRYAISAPMGGKTGTTQNHSDGWFMGFTPSLVGGVWVGGEERSIHFDRMAEGQAANMALPVFGIFLQKVFADPKLGYSQTEGFEVPARYMNPCDSSLNIEEDIMDGPRGIDDIFE